MRQLLDQVFSFFPNSIFSAQFFQLLWQTFCRAKTKNKKGKPTGVASPHLIKLEGAFPSPHSGTKTLRKVNNNKPGNKRKIEQNFSQTDGDSRGKSAKLMLKLFFERE